MYPSCKTPAALLLCTVLTACGGSSSITSSSSTSTSMQRDDTPIVVAESKVLESAAIQPESAVTPKVEPKRHFTAADITDLILVTGQSNATGTETGFDANLDGPDDRVFAFTNNGWQRADLHQIWDRDWFPRGNPGGTPSNNFAFHMGKQISQANNERVVGFVLATAPGEAISHWHPNGGFFNLIDAKVLDAINQLPHKSALDGILWHQGESDEGDHNYHAKLDALIASFRNRSWFSHSKPFICGETAVFEVVNRQLMALNHNGDHWSACVKSESLHTHKDGYHFNAAGLRELGRRYAVRYLAMTGE